MSITKRFYGNVGRENLPWQIQLLASSPINLHYRCRLRPRNKVFVQRFPLQRGSQDWGEPRIHHLSLSTPKTALSTLLRFAYSLGCFFKFLNINTLGQNNSNWKKCWPGPSAETCRGFLLYNFGRILPGIFLEDFFLGTFSHKNEEEKFGEKIRGKIRRRRPQNKNPRKIFSAKNWP